MRLQAWVLMGQTLALINSSYRCRELKFAASHIIFQQLPLQSIFDHTVQQFYITIRIESEALFKDVMWPEITLTGDTPRTITVWRKLIFMTRGTYYESTSSSFDLPVVVRNLTISLQTVRSCIAVSRRPMPNTEP